MNYKLIFFVDFGTWDNGNEFMKNLPMQKSTEAATDPEKLIKGQKKGSSDIELLQGINSGEFLSSNPQELDKLISM